MYYATLRYAQDNLGVKKVSTPLKNPRKCSIICFAREKKITSLACRISSTLTVKIRPKLWAQNNRLLAQYNPLHLGHLQSSTTESKSRFWREFRQCLEKKSHLCPSTWKFILLPSMISYETTCYLCFQEPFIILSWWGIVQCRPVSGALYSPVLG